MAEVFSKSPLGDFPQRDAFAQGRKTLCLKSITTLGVGFGIYFFANTVFMHSGHHSHFRAYPHNPRHPRSTCTFSPMISKISLHNLINIITIHNSQRSHVRHFETNKITHLVIVFVIADVQYQHIGTGIGDFNIILNGN